MACVWSISQAADQGIDLFPFAAISVERPREVLAAGHNTRSWMIGPGRMISRGPDEVLATRRNHQSSCTKDWLVDPAKKELGVPMCQPGTVSATERRDEEIPTHLPAAPVACEVMAAIRRSASIWAISRTVMANLDGARKAWVPASNVQSNDMGCFLRELRCSKGSKAATKPRQGTPKAA
ncbi:hypothetical protein ISN76_10005 [Dyella halodurans]|uniref:Uncharacterized protein n=1 Tax=Dyella halodurans TaxID=1920171 RepID=A0ABV9C226_9GAMM|nr:hypothetical protein [Dyella halodurans]